VEQDNQNNILSQEPVVLEIKSSSLRWINFLAGCVLSVFSGLYWAVFSMTADNKKKTSEVSRKKNKAKKKKEAKKKTPLRSLLTPWIISINFEKKQIEFFKRNWYFLGVDKRVYNFGKIRNTYMNQHIIHADLHIKVYAGTVVGYYFPKKKAALFQNTISRILEDQSN